MRPISARAKIRNETSISAAGMAGVTPCVRSNPTRVARSAAMVGLTCPVCGIGFERYACHARRVKVCYCSHACAGAAKAIPIVKTCVECGATMVTNPTSWAKHRTCSRECLKARRSRGAHWNSGRPGKGSA